MSRPAESGPIPRDEQRDGEDDRSKHRGDVHAVGADRRIDIAGEPFSLTWNVTDELGERDPGENRDRPRGDEREDEPAVWPLHGRS